MEVFIISKEEDFLKIPNEIREKFIHVEFKEENEYQTHKEDAVYKELYKRHKKAKKEISEYLFKKRHN